MPPAGCENSPVEGALTYHHKVEVGVAPGRPLDPRAVGAHFAIRHAFREDVPDHFKVGGREVDG